MTKQQEKKIVLGQFFTKENLWLKAHILEFIKSTKCRVAYDPFAGAGHLLDVAKHIGFETVVGLDIDENLSWQKNDSLISIPHINKETIIITNPPYLSNYSASRKKMMKQVEIYFNSTKYDDLYLLALDNMLKAQDYIVAIIPETFINSNFKKKNYLHSITILEDNPFNDTDTPVIVACFDGVFKDLSKVKIYKNETLVNDLKTIENMRLIPKNNLQMQFNVLDGWLAVRCVDTTNPNHMLKFDFKENMNYDWDSGIKISSRLLTLIDLTVPLEKRSIFINECNYILEKFRVDTDDIVLSPFKGNMKNGQRRRRLDFKTCRAIIELAYNKVVNQQVQERKDYEQLSVF